jgi:hypothetical protein
MYPNLPAYMLKDYHPMCHQHGERPIRVTWSDWKAACDVCGLLTSNFQPRSPATRATVIAFPAAADDLPAAA